MSVIPRGAGTGLSGGAIGDGLVVDFARHNRKSGISTWNAAPSASGAGVVLDQLNDFLHPHGFRFGPDVATSSRATLGGMIANDSSGSHTPVYGTTADARRRTANRHGRRPVSTMSDATSDALQNQRRLVEDLVTFNALQIDEVFRRDLLKRWPGYALARAAQEPDNLLAISGRQRRHAGGDCLRRIENRSPARGARRGRDFFRLRFRRHAGRAKRCST